MADANSVSDTQGLLQSMLQRLKLQSRPENNSTHTQDEEQYSSTLIEQNGSASESPPQTPPMYNFELSMDAKSVVTNLDNGPPSPGSTVISTPLSQGTDVHTSGISTPKQRKVSWWFMSNHSVSLGNSDLGTRGDDGVMLTQARKQSFSLKKMHDGSVSSLQSVESLGVGQKRWTQKLKEKWKDRHKSIPRTEREDRQTQAANSIRPPIPFQALPSETMTTTAFSEEVNVQHQQIKNGPVEDIPSPLDHMSETLFSPGSFNLMDEIFTGQEWAKFFPTSTSSQLGSSSITQARHTSSISQSCQNEQAMLSQWNYREATDPYFQITQAQINSGSFHTMDTTENMLNQRKTRSFGMPDMTGLHNGQYGLSDSGSNHLESMDLSASPLGNNHSIKEQVHMNPNNQSNTIELNVNPALSSEQSVNQSQATEINHIQPGTVQEVLPLLDLSYLQYKDNSSLKREVPLSRKRSHSTERRDSNERWRSETGEMHKWRHNSSASDPAPSLSPASSTSSLQRSLSQDSESSMSTEMVIKKRRVESTRHVRFAEEVTIVPPLLLSDDDDGDADDEDYSHTGNEGNADGGDVSPSRPSVPRWIGALRSKTKRKPKLKLPRMRTKKYNFV